jgi:hypothetical protein
MRKLFLAGAALMVLTALEATAPKKAQAETCPRYRLCMMIYPEGYCMCEGFYCNDEFICGTPIE